MNATPTGLAGAYAALRTLEIPDDWSAEQALAVWELLNALADRIWACYEQPLVALLRADLEHDRDDNQPDLFDPDDSIPF
jgi:hypothetical protein